MDQRGSTAFSMPFSLPAVRPDSWLMRHASDSWLMRHASDSWLTCHASDSWLMRHASDSWLTCHASDSWLTRPASHASHVPRVRLMAHASCVRLMAHVSCVRLMAHASCVRLHVPHSAPFSRRPLSVMTTTKRRHFPMLPPLDLRPLRCMAWGNRVVLPTPYSSMGAIVRIKTGRGAQRSAAACCYSTKKGRHCAGPVPDGVRGLFGDLIDRHLTA